ncbi:MAG: IS66 family insertion sequence element accessory protein TnpB [Petrimonas sp.]|nr:IS66 family insertion sequence element accessory protein TnpB [Petrimonas sp.]
MNPSLRQSSSHQAAMFSLNDSLRYLLYNRPCDMRKSFHTLGGIVTDTMGADPCNGDVYIFYVGNKIMFILRYIHLI